MSGGEMKQFRGDSSLPADHGCFFAGKNAASSTNLLDSPADARSSSGHQLPEKSRRAAAAAATEEGGEQDVGDEGDEHGDGDVEVDGGGESGESGGHLQIQQLGEGFYDLEAIRKKRIRRGKVEYLIKWRGWPESANTWEPIENLETCPDVIAAFERRLLSRKQGRKPKSNTITTKKLQNFSSVPTNTTYITDRNDNQSFSPPPPPPPLPLPPAPAANNNRRTSHIETRQRRRLSIAVAKGKALAASSMDEPESSTENHVYDKLCSETDSGRHLPDELNENHEQDRVPGDSVLAKRRKLGPIKQNPNGDACNDVPDVTVMAPDSNLVAKPGFEDGCSIAEIVNILKFEEASSNYTPDVLEIFVVRRSDGREVTANKAFLKANYTFLLIEFYERLLREFLRS
ncbi:unnamed protein product [Cuscuta campestris]|uniref:Chromo domain-containing protein n=1 Tax=Cuscuta campestris TaxID=132261 RepID=A0A484M887_9ASTE|nr:unnamed protein product [Cuscuta campestris]